MRAQAIHMLIYLFPVNHRSLIIFIYTIYSYINYMIRVYTMMILYTNNYDIHLIYSTKSTNFGNALYTFFFSYQYTQAISRLLSNNLSHLCLR